MRGIWRLTVVSALAAVAFVAALVHFRAVPLGDCRTEAVTDPSFRVEFLTPFGVDPTSHTVRVTRNGVPVTGAQVCLRADIGGMGGTSATEVSDLGRETGPGQYDVRIRFDTGGSWNGTVIVATAAGKSVRIPIPIEVRG